MRRYIPVFTLLAALLAGPALADQSDGRTDVAITWMDNETFWIDRPVYYGCMAVAWDKSLADEYWDGSWEADCYWVDPPCGVVFHLCPESQVDMTCQTELGPGALIMFVFMGADIPCAQSIDPED